MRDDDDDGDILVGLLWGLAAEAFAVYLILLALRYLGII